MNCQFCKAELQNDAAFCPECGAKVEAQVDHKSKIDTLKLNSKNIIAKNLGGVMFLIISIVMSVLLLGDIIRAFGDLGNAFAIVGFAGFLGVFNLLYAFAELCFLVFPILAVIGCWLAFASAKKGPNASAVGKFRLYPKFMSIVAIINLVLFCIVAGICFILLIGVLAVGEAFLGDFMSFFYEMGVDVSVLSVLEVGAIAFALILMLIVAAAIVLQVFFAKAYKSISNHLEVLGNASETGVYNVQAKAPFISLFVFGGFNVIGALFTIAGNFGAGLSGLAWGAAMILLAIFFKQIADEEIANANELNAEIEAYNAEAAQLRAQEQAQAQAAAQAQAQVAAQAAAAQAAAQVAAQAAAAQAAAQAQPTESEETRMLREQNEMLKQMLLNNMKKD